VPEPLLVAVAGPTGAGKSELALTVAAWLDGEIVNCDSLQVYRGFDIGTAKVPPAERRGIPHHLIDILDPAAEYMTAGDYARRAREILRQVIDRKRIPVVVGGTGFYLRALLDGLFEGPGRNHALRARLAAREARRKGLLHRLLRRLDPEAARRIHPHDVNKLIRAVEVCLQARRPMTGLLAQGKAPLTGFQVVKLGLLPPRAALYERINRRTAAMFATGLLDEVRNLLACGVPPSAKPFEAIGYREALLCVQDRLTIDQAIPAVQQATRRYAKRQITWFRKEPGIHWLAGFGDEPAIQHSARQWLAGFLSPGAGTANHSEARRQG
jgi:tRNA dimethylallyltransferase